MPKLLEGTDLMKVARLLLWLEVEEEEGGAEERWKPMFKAALTMRSFRQVRWGSSGMVVDVVVVVVGFMIVEVEEPVRAEEEA